MPVGRTWPIVAGSAAIGLAVAVGAVATAGPWESGQRTAERAYAAARDRRLDRPAGGAHAAPGHGAGPAAWALPPARAAAPVLVPASAGGTGTAPPLAPRLNPLMSAPGLGPLTTGAVIDVAGGRLLYGHDPATATTPASTTKLATAVAALGVLGPDHRLTTSVVSTGPGRIVLVGGGDPTLDLTQLAADTAAALKSGGTRTVTLTYDTSWFGAPALHTIGYNDNLAPVTALMADEGRLDNSSSGPAPRAQDPAASAAASFASLLAGHGVTVRDEPEPGSGKGGTVLATQQSAALSDLVERMLTNSDNDLAEALVRQTARALGLPATFAGGAQAVRRVLGRYGVPLTGAVFTDGSGLDHRDRLSPQILARVLALAAAPDHPELRPVLTGLPVAGFTGTLSSRFRATPGAGVVHAKTGTLTGTNTIAGTTVTPEGRLLAFSFMTQGAPDPSAAQSALDRLATALAGS
ncbi:D-alanyl-D-alanine carboxypeptidase/D-alanyl-D-alanine endopeptidase [Actinacidiphila acididurans]|uniref:D-alanyl-D-alanine carboxypeptidase/D-alanyl-D-alanine-endopeptidase n=1 Tax=Actinacidiphila acididurans TaxID=2784346 RepID=A0ABS2TRT5_9ACTN|nr:D-alanyl-D-alanine carboxypeptidase/D-alanyl-D-alanine-endopeptidase [Actinacidiphila acididurans]MBM9505226.1 D-alanyl-D-alanine carboxypeptidase/D-alanyl-D-alanine-endopeptidase [Actinacidiphila acididurans]